jgi:hypothetical protein
VITKGLPPIVAQVAGHGLTLEEYNTFKDILHSEIIFESEAQKSFYDEVGYRDEAVQEDEEENKLFKSGFDRDILK